MIKTLGEDRAAPLVAHRDPPGCDRGVHDARRGIGHAKMRGGGSGRDGPITLIRAVIKLVPGVGVGPKTEAGQAGMRRIPHHVAGVRLGVSSEGGASSAAITAATMKDFDRRKIRLRNFTDFGTIMPVARLRNGYIPGLRMTIVDFTGLASASVHGRRLTCNQDANLVSSSTQRRAAFIELREMKSERGFRSRPRSPSAPASYCSVTALLLFTIWRRRVILEAVGNLPIHFR